MAIFVTGEIVTATKLNASVSPTVYAQAVDLTGTAITNAETVELTANLTVPAAWSGYLVEAQFVGDIRESGTLTADRTITCRIRLTDATGVILGATAITLQSAGTAQRAAIPVLGFANSQTATGTIPVVMTAEAGTEGSLMTLRGTLIAHAVRTT